MSFQVIQAVSMSENAAPATCPCPGTSMKDSNGSLNHLEHPIYQMIEECLQKVEAIEKKKKKKTTTEIFAVCRFFCSLFFYLVFQEYNRRHILGNLLELGLVGW